MTDKNIDSVISEVRDKIKKCCKKYTIKVYETNKYPKKYAVAATIDLSVDVNQVAAAIWCGNRVDLIFNTPPISKKEEKEFVKLFETIKH